MPGGRDSNRAGGQTYGLRHQRADDRDDAALAIEHRRAGGAVIEHQAVVAVMHFEQRRPGERALAAEFHEAAAGKPQPPVGVGETENALLGV